MKSQQQRVHGIPAGVNENLPVWRKVEVNIICWLFGDLVTSALIEESSIEEKSESALGDNRVTWELEIESKTVIEGHNGIRS